MTVTLAVPEVATVSQIEVSPAVRDPRRRLTRLPVSKLPSRPDLPGPIAPYPELSDQDIATGHRESVRDQTLPALAVCPGWLPLILRRVELLPPPDDAGVRAKRAALAARDRETI